MEAVASDRRYTAAPWHIPIYFMNTIALMFWANKFSATPVSAFFYITLPFAFVFAVIPYLVCVVLPGLCKPRLTVILGGVISALIALRMGVWSDASTTHTWGKFWFALQASFVPCSIYAGLKALVAKDNEKYSLNHERATPE